MLAPLPQTHYVFDEDGAQLVDRVLRFETFSEEFEEVVAHLGIEGVVLDHFNQSYHAPWTDAYVPDTFDLVAERASPDCAAFGYATEVEAYGIS